MLVYRYGYKYDCIGGEPSSQLCELAPYDFRGSPCSDAVGRQKEYQEIMQGQPPPPLPLPPNAS